MTDVHNLPQWLRNNGRFCCWRQENRDGRATKVPYDPQTGARVDITKQNALAPLAAAETAQAQFDGLGVGVFPPLALIDVDSCVSAAGELSPLAADLLSTVPSYAEYSPSGTGVHIWLLAPNFQYDKSRFFTKNAQIGLEIYTERRFGTLTGRALTAGADLADCGEQLTQILEKYMVRPKAGVAPTVMSRKPVALSDDEILKKALGQAAFAQLWEGDTTGYPSRSEADLALCNRLAFWTNGDPERVDRLFRRSGLMRDKWDSLRGNASYGEFTVKNTCDTLKQGYDPDSFTMHSAQDDFAGLISTTAMPTLISAADVPYEPPRWLIEPYFQRGKGTLIQGDNGTGKTAFMCAVAAHVTTGRPLLTCPVETPGNVLFLSVEDDLPVLRGRLEADGGDLDKCHFLTNAAGLIFNSPDVEAAISAINARLVIFDPFQAFLGAGVDMFRANEVQPELAKLFAMCARHDCSCAIIAHMGKSGGDKSPVNRSLGTVDIPAAMRSILQLIRNPDDESECLVVHVKCSNAPRGRSLAYFIADRGSVVWNGFSGLTAEDLSTIVKRREKEIPYENEPLVQVFKQLITDKTGGGFWSYADLKRESQKILGFPPFDSVGDLRRKLDGGLSRELQNREGLIVTHGERGNRNVRGIRIERYQLPQGCQTKIRSG